MSKKITFHNEKRKIGDLIPHAYNPRRLSGKQVTDLTKSLAKFSLAEIPVINTDNTIIAGHQRLKILAQIEGVDAEIDVRVPNRPLTQQEVDEYLIRSNKNTGEWDMDALAENFMFGDLTEWGFNPEELLAFDEKTEVEQDDEILALPLTPISKPGAIYQLGKHLLMCGDSTSETDVERLMGGKKAAMCFTDPPYNVNYTGGMGGKSKNVREGILNDKMSGEQFYQFLLAVNKNILRWTEGGGLRVYV